MAYYLIQDNNDDFELVLYGIKAIFSSVLCICNALLICAIFNKFIEGILFIVFLTPIKMCFESYHCKTMMKCIITYGLTVQLFIWGANYILKLDEVIIFFLCFFLLCLIKIHHFNKTNNLILLIYLFLGILAFFISNKSLALLTSSVLMEFVLIIFADIQNLKNAKNLFN